MTQPLSPIHAPLEFGEWAGECRDAVCVCLHKLSRHANPHYGHTSSLILTDQCLDCADCKAFRMPIANSMDPLIPSRIARLAQLDSHSLSGRQHSLGPGGASAMFTQAVQRALIEEMAAQLRIGELCAGSHDQASEIGQWAAEIIAAFREG